jgi:primosomal protein N' (replication factor Y)
MLLGSATPRPESAHRMASSVLPRRVDGRPLPEVQVLDMRGQPHGLHPLSAQALADVRDRRYRGGGKAIVLLNRRGWSNFLSCRSCGRVWSCPQCDVALVLHLARGQIACHHCGHRQPAPSRCGECSSTSVARHGGGTERQAHELAKLLDDGFPVFRLDADVIAEGPGAILHRFEQAERGVLIGTQMVAKGHDFPDVELGVVLDADATLRFPDFRAEERTFALIAQLAGRVGRGGEGRVLVQTIAPESHAIVHAAGHDSDGFLARELERRSALSYPPFSHLIRIVFAARQSEPALAAADAVRERLLQDASGVDACVGDGPAVLGPAALFRLRGRERQVLVVKAGDRRPAVAAVREAVQGVAGARRHAGVNFSVDVDPQ